VGGAGLGLGGGLGDGLSDGLSDRLGDALGLGSSGKKNSVKGVRLGGRG
jgi:hypothetical protein